MKIMKNISRYFFMTLLMAGCVLWSIYCSNVAAQLQAQIESADFIDMAVNSTSDAIAILEQQEHFEALTRYGIIAAIVVVLLTCTMLVTPILVKKWKNRSKKKNHAVTQPPPKPSAPVRQAPPETAFPEPPVILEAPLTEPSVAPEESLVEYEEPTVVFPKPQDTADAPRPVSQVQPSIAASCPHCGKQQDAYAKFCFNCGQPL